MSAADGPPAKHATTKEATDAKGSPPDPGPISVVYGKELSPERQAEFTRTRQKLFAGFRWVMRKWKQENADRTAEFNGMRQHDPMNWDEAYNGWRLTTTFNPADPLFDRYVIAPVENAVRQGACTGGIRCEVTRSIEDEGVGWKIVSAL
jgi:hypothetical protein